MKQFIRSLFWPGKVIDWRVPEIQKEIDAEHGIKPAPIFKPDFYRRLSEASHVQVWNMRETQGIGDGSLQMQQETTGDAQGRPKGDQNSANSGL